MIDSLQQSTMITHLYNFQVQQCVIVWLVNVTLRDLVAFHWPIVRSNLLRDWLLLMARCRLVISFNTSDRTTQG